MGIAGGLNIGLSITDSTEELRKQFGIEEDVRRPVIVEVIPGSIAARAGLMAGDVVLDVNRKEITKAQDFNKHLKKGTNTLRIARQGAVLFLMATL